MRYVAVTVLSLCAMLTAVAALLGVVALELIRRQLADLHRELAESLAALNSRAERLGWWLKAIHANVKKLPNTAETDAEPETAALGPSKNASRPHGRPRTATHSPAPEPAASAPPPTTGTES